MWLLAPNHRADFFDALCNLLWRVTLVALTRGDDNHLRGEVVQLAILETPKDILGPVPRDAKVEGMHEAKAGFPDARVEEVLDQGIAHPKYFWLGISGLGQKSLMLKL